MSDFDNIRLNLARRRVWLLPFFTMRRGLDPRNQSDDVKQEPEYAVLGAHHLQYFVSALHPEFDAIHSLKHFGDHATRQYVPSCRCNKPQEKPHMEVSVASPEEPHDRRALRQEKGHVEERPKERGLEADNSEEKDDEISVHMRMTERAGEESW